MYDLLNAETKSKFLCLPYTKKIFFSGIELFKEKGERRIQQKTKRRLFNCSRIDDYDGPRDSYQKAS